VGATTTAMFNHYEKQDRHLASIDRSLATIAGFFAKANEIGLFDHLAAACGSSLKRQATTEGPRADMGPGQWMTRKEAWHYLGVAKSTLEEMIRTGKLPTYLKQGDERKKKARVWLKRGDVERMYRSYPLRKGKEKKS